MSGAGGDDRARVGVAGLCCVGSYVVSAWGECVNTGYRGFEDNIIEWDMPEHGATMSRDQKESR